MKNLIKNQHKQIIDWISGKTDYHKYYFELENKYFFAEPNGYFANAIEKDYCLLNLDKFNFNETLGSTMKDSFEDLTDLEPTDKYLKKHKKELIEFYRCGEHKEIVYVDNKLLSKFKDCKFKQTTENKNGSIFIFKDDNLVGLVLPTIVAD